MHLKTAHVIIDNDEEMDIASLAAAHSEITKHAEKKKKPAKGGRSAGWDKLKENERREFVKRKVFSKVWDRLKTP